MYLLDLYIVFFKTDYLYHVYKTNVLHKLCTTCGEHFVFVYKCKKALVANNESFYRKMMLYFLNEGLVC